MQPLAAWEMCYTIRAGLGFALEVVAPELEAWSLGFALEVVAPELGAWSLGFDLEVLAPELGTWGLTKGPGVNSDYGRVLGSVVTMGAGRSSA